MNIRQAQYNALIVIQGKLIYHGAEFRVLSLPARKALGEIQLSIADLVDIARRQTPVHKAVMRKRVKKNTK